MYSEKKHLIQSSINSRDVIDKSRSAVPTVVEQSGRGERAFDIYSRLLRERIIFLGTGINDQVSDSLVAQLLFLEAEDGIRDRPLSRGLGDVYKRQLLSKKTLKLDKERD